MLEKYMDEQPVLYNLLHNSIVNDKLSHSYLFESNGNSDVLDIILSFVKEIFCPKVKDCCNCSICNRIDNGNYIDLKIINPDGLVIKKEQLQELQNEFSKVSFEGNKKVYIINDCERMNLQASNSILKFLEEPVDNIIAILVTNNINNVLKTIISRCQVISLNKKNSEISNNGLSNIANVICKSEVDRNNFLVDEKNILIYNSIVDFMDYFYDNRLNAFVFSKKYFSDILKERSDYILAFDIMIKFYYDVLKYKLFGQVVIFTDKIDLVKKISNMSIEELLFYLENLIKFKKLIYNNLNMNLLIDCLLIKLERR